MSKKLSIILIVLLTILLAFVIGIMIFLFKGGVDKLNWNFNTFHIGIGGGNSTKLVDSKEVTNNKKLNVEFDVADVEVVPSETESIKVELYSDNPGEYEITESEEDIKVVLKEKENQKFSLKKKMNKIKLYVPLNYISSFNINGTTGDITMDEYSSATLNATINTGDIKIKEINMAEINATTGDIEVESASLLNVNVRTGDIDVGTVRFLTVNATTGDIDAKEVDRVKVVVTTGDIDLYKVNEYLSLEAVTGDIDINTANIKDNSRIKVTTGDIKIEHATGYYVSGEAKIGDVKIKGVDRKSDLELTIEAKVGDIRVN